MNSLKVRLDLCVSKKFNISRNLAQEYIEQGYVFVNNKKLTKCNAKIDENSLIELNVIAKTESVYELKESNLNVEIVYEDEYIFIVNKPSGIITHPTNYEKNDTLANIMKRIFREKNISIFGDYFRNGIVHRLDKDTSGLIIVAKNEVSYNTFISLIKDKKISRKYLALVCGYLKTNTVEVQAPILRIDDTNKREVSVAKEAQDATTIFIEKERYNDFSLIECELLTGRTHQIRVHASYLKNYLINDPVYGFPHEKEKTNYGQYLCAYKLEFFHPFINNKWIEVQIDMPKEFLEYINKWGEKNV